MPGASLPSGAQWDTGAHTLRITGDNVTLENLDIAGAVAIDGDNATIRNSRIAVSNGCSSPCGSSGIRLGETDATVTGTVLQNLDIVTAEKDPSNDNPLDPATIDTKLDHGVRNNGDLAVTADHLYIKGFAGAWKGPGTIENSLPVLPARLRRRSRRGLPQRRRGQPDDPRPRHHPQPGRADRRNLAVQRLRRDRTVDVVDNLLAGGGYVMYGGAKNGTGNVTGPILIKGNRIARGRQDSHGYYSNGGEIGLWAEFTGTRRGRAATTGTTT